MKLVTGQWHFLIFMNVRIEQVAHITQLHVDLSSMHTIFRLFLIIFLLLWSTKRLLDKSEIAASWLFGGWMNYLGPNCRGGGYILIIYNFSYYIHVDTCVQSYISSSQRMKKKIIQKLSKYAQYDNFISTWKLNFISLQIWTSKRQYLGSSSTSLVKQRRRQRVDLHHSNTFE